MIELSAQFWENKYNTKRTGWDTGSPTQPFVDFFKTLKSKTTRILIPGCGHAYEGELLHSLGFKNVTLLDVSPTAKAEFTARVPQFPADKYLIGDFFSHFGNYDLIVEQTFFCALPPSLRTAYAKKMHSLLSPNGRLVGVLFVFPRTQSGPPFGGSSKEYRALFEPYFTIETLAPCYNSIKPRRNNEVFIHLRKKQLD